MTESNHRPFAYEANALPTKLNRLAGINLSTSNINCLSCDIVVKSSSKYKKVHIDTWNRRIKYRKKSDNHSQIFEFLSELLRELLNDIFLEILVDTGLEKYTFGSVVCDSVTSVFSFLFSNLVNKSKFSFNFFRRYFS